MPDGVMVRVFGVLGLLFRKLFRKLKCPPAPRVWPLWGAAQNHARAREARSS
jgi:hypothetical protein